MVLTRREKNSIAGVTGHIAESVAAALLVDLGWHVLWHFIDTGRHGVDLIMLSPDDRVVAIEVKGTLVPGRVPRLSRRELGQMTLALDRQGGQPGDAEPGARER